MHQQQDTQLGNDPIQHAAQIIAGEAYQPLEMRLKRDIFESLCRIKPELREQYQFNPDVTSGSMFPQLTPPLQGIAIARTEGALAFYQRVGWHPGFLEAALQACIEDSEHLDTLKGRYHASTLHDLAYVHPRHFEKLMGKAGAASLWENLKQWAQRQSGGSGRS